MTLLHLHMGLVLLPVVKGLIVSMTKPNGDPDLFSVMNHVYLMEQTITTLQKEVQTSNSELTSVKEKLKTTEENFSSSRDEIVLMKQTITTLQTQLHDTNSELALVKRKLISTEGILNTTQDEISAVRAKMRLAEADIAHLKTNPKSIEFAELKKEVSALNVSHNTLVHRLNFTVIDSVSADVKSNTIKIQSLNSNLLATKTAVRNISRDLYLTNADVGNLISQMTETKTEIQRTAQEMNRSTPLLETRLSVIETEYSSLQSRQNIHEQHLAENKALLQSTVSDVKMQLNTLSGKLTSVQQEISSQKPKSVEDVAFQVTLQGLNSAGWTTLKFDTVDRNTGDGYNKTTGIFTAPVSGTYLFWGNVESLNPKGNHYLYIHKGHDILASGFHRVNDNNDSGVATTMSVTHLLDGEQVHFTTDKTSNWIVGSGYSSYGGVLLHTV